MTILLINYLAIFCYLTSSFLLLREIIYSKPQNDTIKLAWVAALAHMSAVTSITIQENTINFGFFNIASIISAIITLLLLLTNLNKPSEKLGIVLFPLAALMLVLNLYFPSQEHTMQTYSWQMNTHILSSILAFSLLNIAALQAIFLAIQEQQLRRHPPRKLILSLPSLQSMESLLFQMIGTGVILLTLSLGSGFFFIENLFAQHLVHKTILSILAWLIFSALLFGRIRYGWRGQVATQWTLIGFTLLLLAYFGSKMVLELILTT